MSILVNSDNYTYIFPKNERFNMIKNPFTNTNTDNMEKNYELCDRVYSYLWFMKNYMESRNINGEYIDQLQTAIKSIDDFKNMISEDGTTDKPATFGKTFFYKNFYNDEYKNGHLMNIPTDDQKKIINSLIINSLHGDSVNSTLFLEKIHIDPTYYNIFVKNGDFVINNTDKTIYDDKRKLYDTGDIGRLLSDMISYNTNYDNDFVKYYPLEYNEDDSVFIYYKSLYWINSITFLANQIMESSRGSTNNVIYLLICNPEYFPKDSTELDITQLCKYYNPYGGKLSQKPLFLTNTLNKLSCCKDAFNNGGIYIFDQKLAFLIQYFELKFDDEKSNMWKAPYYTTIGSKNLIYVNNGIRITILTLQKYAAIRRYMWSKDPDYASEVYKSDPQNIINELRDPYSLLPYTDKHISEFTKYQDEKYNEDPRYVPNTINLTLIPYSIFVGYPQDKKDEKELQQLKARLKKQIDEEIVANWTWATNELKTIGEIYKELDALILHTSDWTLNRPYQDIEKIEIKRIPEVEAIFAPLLAKKEIEYEKEHPEVEKQVKEKEVKEQVKEKEVIFAPHINDVPIQEVQVQEKKSEQVQVKELVTKPVPEPRRLFGLLGPKKPKEKPKKQPTKQSTKPLIKRFRNFVTGKKSKGGSRNKTVKKKNLKKS